MIGQRVRHVIEDRIGFVVGSAESIGTRHTLVPVTIELSTRTELWPTALMELLPKNKQFPAHGGRFKAPSTYPLHIK